MKSILLLGLLLALGMSCGAQDEAPCMEEWKDFIEMVQGGLCKPETTDDSVMKALLDCKSVLSAHQEQLDKFKQMSEQVYEKCGTPNEADIKDYTKVDVTNTEYKQLLMQYCSPNMKTCVHDIIEEWKKNNPDHKPDESKKFNLTDAEKEQLNVIK